MSWLTGNISTLIIALALCGIVALIVAKLVRDKRKGKHLGCDCGCEGCASADEGCADGKTNM